MQCLSSKRYVIIVAGGSGRRMNASLEKQFMRLGKSVVLLETLRMVRSSAPTAEILLVLAQERFDFWRQICQEYSCDIPHRLIAGGSERFYSVKAAVDAIEQSSEKALVAVHDGVRPFADKEIFSSCFEVAEKNGAAVACIDCTDSIRYDNTQIDRSKVKLIQTPQCFDLALLKRAYAQEFTPSLTDDASLVECLGVKPVLVEGNAQNIKITRPMDFLIAESIINGKANQ